jgi:phosphate transport system permease protein
MKSRPNPVGDRIFAQVTRASAVLIILVLAGIVAALFINSMPSIARFGVSFITTDVWNPVTAEYGALSSIFGTVVSTLIAIVLAVPLSLIVALFLVELVPPSVSKPIAYAIELLAAVPSIVFGMWGLFSFAPFMADHVQPFLKDTLGFLPFFKGPVMGIGMLTSGIVLALMILPFITAVMRDVFTMVPPVIKEACYGMGSTTWEVTKKITVRYGFSGLVGAVFLGLGRAVGETMAVTFVIGNNHEMSASLFAAGNSIASTLANEFAEASEPIYLSALMELGLVLFVMTVIIQIASQLWIRRVVRKAGRGL